MACGEYKKKTTRILSEKHRKAIRDALSGKKLSEEHKQKIAQGKKNSPCKKKSSK